VTRRLAAVLIAAFAALAGAAVPAAADDAPGAEQEAQPLEENRSLVSLTGVDGPAVEFHDEVVELLS
jgi:hypothetical protein